jgi:hypothetical protein
MPAGRYKITPALAGVSRVSGRSVLERTRLTPDGEARKDVWDLAAFGLRGRLDLTPVRQRWLRESARRWAADNLPRRRGKIADGFTLSGWT